MTESLPKIYALQTTTDDDVRLKLGTSNDMRLENRCYSSSAINNDNVKCTAEIDSSNVNQHTLRDTKKGKNSGGFFSFLQKLRVVNKSDLVDSTFSLPSPYSSQYSVATGRAGRWESAESVISSATASSFAFIPPHQLRQFNYTSANAQRKHVPSPSNASLKEAKENVCETRQDHLLRRKYRPPINGEENAFADAKKLYRNSTGNIKNIVVVGNEPYLNDLVSAANSALFVSRKESTQKEKRKRCHKPGKRKAPEPPYPYCDNIDDSSLSKKISTRRKKRKAPSPPKIMAEKDELRGQGKEENVPAIYNDSLKLEKGVLKAIKSCNQSANPNENSVIAGNSNNATSVPVSPKPWYKRRSVNASMKKITKLHEKGDSRRNCGIDEWMLEGGLPRIKRTSDDASKRTSQISMLANISELDREACEIIENERKKKREAEKKFYSDSLYDDDDDDNNGNDGGLSAKTCASNAKKSDNKDLISILNNITNVTTKITVNSPIFTKSIDVANHHSPREQRAANSSLIHHTKVPKNNYSAENKTKSETVATSNTQKLEKKKTAQESVKAMVSKSDSSYRCSEKVESKLIGQRHLSSHDVHYAAHIRPVKPFSSWTCPQCTLENPSWKFICEMCHKWRPYSVNRTTQNVVVNPKEDITLKSKHEDDNDNNEEDDDDGMIASDVKRHDEKIRSNANSLTGDSSTSTSRREPANNENSANDKNETASTFNTHLRMHSLASNDLILRDLEKIRKARLQFFSKNITNKWNRGQTLEKAARNDDNSKDKLCEILKELKDSLPYENNAAKTNRISYAFKSNFGATSADWLVNDRNSNSISGCKSISNAFNHASSTKSEVDSVVRTNVQEPAVLDRSNEDPLRSWRQRRSHPSSNVDKELLNDEAQENRKVTALAINRLLKKLQTAIGNGQHHEAANIARELARLKVNCHVTRRTAPNGLHSPKPEKRSTFAISLYINENDDRRGPIPLQIDNTMTLRKLKMKILDEFKIPLDSQRWIFEKTILDNDHDVLEDVGIDKPGVPLYLNLISNNLKKESSDNKLTQKVNDISKNVTIDEHCKSSNDSSRIESGLQESTRQHDHPVDDKEQPGELTFQAEKKTFQATDGAVVVVNETDNKIQMSVSSSSNALNTAEIDEEEPNAPGWKCGLCTLINETDRKFCSVCGHQRKRNAIGYAIKIDEKTSSKNSNANADAVQNDLAEILQQKSTNYQELIDLEKSDLIANKDDFECRVCLVEYRNGEGIVLRDCLHTFCKECLKQTIQHTTEAEVKCPFRDGNYSCESVLQQREIKALVDADVYEKHLARSVSEAENKIKNAFHCKTANCPGWCIYEDNVNEFHCPVCERTNCLTCQVIHTGLNCKQYQEMTRNDLETSADASKTKSLLQEMVEKGEAMICPTCEIILMKKWGCDWLRCSMCKTEICWVTRGSRWGPAGKGDTTGGCRCGVNGIKCHPKCNYCH